MFEVEDDDEGLEAGLLEALADDDDGEWCIAVGFWLSKLSAPSISLFDRLVFVG